MSFVERRHLRLRGSRKSGRSRSTTRRLQKIVHQCIRNRIYSHLRGSQLQIDTHFLRPLYTRRWYEAARLLSTSVQSFGHHIKEMRTSFPCSCHRDFRQRQTKSLPRATVLNLATSHSLGECQAFHERRSYLPASHIDQTLDRHSRRYAYRKALRRRMCRQNRHIPVYWYTTKSLAYLSPHLRSLWAKFRARDCLMDMSSRRIAQSPSRLSTPYVWEARS